MNSNTFVCITNSHGLVLVLMKHFGMGLDYFMYVGDQF